MTKPTGTGRGGKRPGAGRKRREPWEELWWSGFKGGDTRKMIEADRMRAEAKASGQALEGKSKVALNLTDAPVAALDPPESATPAPISAAQGSRMRYRGLSFMHT